MAHIHRPSMSKSSDSNCSHSVKFGTIHQSKCLKRVLKHHFSKQIFFFPVTLRPNVGSWPPHSWGLVDHTQRRNTVGRTPLEEWSARLRDLYLTKHDTHNRQKSMPPVGFEPTISVGERPQTYALDRAATGTGIFHSFIRKSNYFVLQTLVRSCTKLIK